MNYEIKKYSLKTAAKEGAYNATENIVKYAIIGAVALTIIYVIGEKRIKKITKKARGVL